MQIQQHSVVLWISGFNVQNTISLPPALARWQSQRGAIPASALPSMVGCLEGHARVARAGETRQGVLTYGPYARLLPGIYEIVVRYGPSVGNHKWDVALRGEDGVRVIRTGTIEATASEDVQIVVPITLTKPAKDFQVRTFYLGNGQLTIRSVGIRPSGYQSKNSREPVPIWR